jgi:hypothetical protein
MILKKDFESRRENWRLSRTAAPQALAREVRKRANARLLRHLETGR